MEERKYLLVQNIKKTMLTGIVFLIIDSLLLITQYMNLSVFSVHITHNYLLNSNKENINHFLKNITNKI